MDPLVRQIYIQILKKHKPVKIVEKQDNIYRVWLGNLPYKYLKPKGVKDPDKWYIQAWDEYRRRK